MSLTNEELLILDNLIYINYPYDEEVTNISLKDTITYIIKNLGEYTKGDPAGMNTEQWREFLTSVQNNPKYSNFLREYSIDISNYVTNDSDENGLRAACFVKRDSDGKVEDVAAIFRGTSGGAEWKDDVMMANATASSIMNDAAKYIINLPEEYGNNITVSGHSKGGNKAQYVTIVTDRIGRCVSFDGQGFSQEFLDFYSKRIKERKALITSISSQYDYVNALMYPA